MDNFKLPMNLQLFAEGDEPNPEQDPKPETKLVPQDEVDRIVAERLARERKKYEKYADYDDLKTKLTEFEKAEAERKQSELSVAERLEAEKADALKKAQEAEERGNAAITAANQRLINAEFKALAREANVPADRLAAALRLADLSGVTVGEDGEPSGVADAIKALVEAHPYLVAATQPKPIGERTPGVSESQEKTKEQILAEAKAKAERNPTPDAIARYTSLKRQLNG